MSTIAHNAIASKRKRPLPERGELTRDDLNELAEKTAREMLGVSAAEAFSLLDQGELDGTLAGSALRSLRFLLAA